MATGTTDTRVQQAMQALKAGRRGEAKKLLEAVLTDDPDQPVARNLLGMDAMAAGDATAAARHFEAAVRAEPRALPLWINLAGAYRALGRDDEERRALLSALDIDQRHLTALIRLAELHERCGELGEATIRWGGVVALSAQFDGAPPEIQGRFEHARAFMARRTERLAEAVAADLAEDLQGASERDCRRLRTAADVMLGRRPVYVNQCGGMHYPFLPADEYFDAAHFPWFEQLEAGTETIRDELLQILSGEESGLAPYVAMAPGTPHNKWSVLDRKLDWSALHLWKEGARVDEACAKAPKTAALVEQLPLCRIPGRAPTVFFSLLKAGSHIPAHRRHQHPRDHPSAAGGAGGLPVPGRRRDPAVGGGQRLRVRRHHRS